MYECDSDMVLRGVIEIIMGVLDQERLITTVGEGRSWLG